MQNKQRIEKWLDMQRNWDTFTSVKKHKLKSRIRKGIPHSLRAKIWKKLLSIDKISNEQKLYYSKLCLKNPNPKFQKTIDVDIYRTFPNHESFCKDNNTKTKTTSLRNVLYAYCNYDTFVGYTQGMAFIVAMFLMLMNEVETFWCFCKLLDDNGKFGMRKLYCDGLPLLHLHYFQFDQLLKIFSPNLYIHIKSFEITPELYTANWFLTIFCRQFPMSVVYRIWDIYLSEGTKFIFRISLALLKLNSKQLLRIKQFDIMLRYLLDLHKYCGDIDMLINESFIIAIKHKHLQSIQLKYDKNSKKMKIHRSKLHGNAEKPSNIYEFETNYKSHRFHFV